MKLIPLDRPDLIRLVANWLAARENYQWLDFGAAGQPPTEALIKIMTQRETNVLRVFTADDDHPIGVVGFTGVDPQARTATIWVVLGDKSYAHRGYATWAVSKMLSFGFGDLGLKAITTWIVDGNPSLQMVEPLNFRFIGRQRNAHYFDGQARDRLLFDILASEHVESQEPPTAGSQKGTHGRPHSIA